MVRRGQRADYVDEFKDVAVSELGDDNFSHGCHVVRVGFLGKQRLYLQISRWLGMCK